MMQVREAIEKSRTYLEEVFPFVEGSALQLEGVELSDDGQFWYVTFSYLERSRAGASVPTFSAYKTIKVRAEDGVFYGAKNGLASLGMM